MLEEANLQFQTGITNPFTLKANLTEYLANKFLNSWTDDINRNNARRGSGQNKLRTYKLFKSSYINCIMSHRYRSAYARFRCGVAPLRLETGRYERLPEDLRLCFSCPDSTENEEHVLLKCPIYNNLRENMFTVLKSEFPNMEHLSDQDKLRAILSCELNKSIRICAKTCFEILRTRRDMLYK